MADHPTPSTPAHAEGRRPRAHRSTALTRCRPSIDVARLPFSLKVLLENLLRTEGNGSVEASDIEALANWDHRAEPDTEIAFTPARVVLQDFTGVPAVVDLAAMRDAMTALGGDPAKINPLVPAELVIDHSVQVDVFGTARRFRINAEREFERNEERYQFLRWGQTAFDGFKVVPPDTGIVHQVNLEYLSRVVFVNDKTGEAYPDTLVGTDSHTTMVNGLGVLGWGVGGIEAEAAMLGQPMSMLIPQVLGFKLTRRAAGGRDGDRPGPHRHRAAARARRRRQVRRVLRPGRRRAAAGRPRDDRQHEPRVRLDVRDLPDRRRDAALPEFSGRPKDQIDARRGLRQGAGPLARRARRGADVLRHHRARPRRGRAVDRRPQAPAGPRSLSPRPRSSSPRPSKHLVADDRDHAGPRIRRLLPGQRPGRGVARHATATARARRPHDQGEVAVPPAARDARVTLDGEELRRSSNGDVVIAAITSCTNTSNPSVMLGAGPAGPQRAGEGPRRASRGSRPRWPPARRSSPSTSTAPG